MTTSVTEFKDKRGENRLRVKAEENGRILTSSTQGYKNKSEMRSSAIRAAKAILLKYNDLL